MASGSEPAVNTPYGRVYLSSKTEQIMNCAIGLKHPINVDAVKKAFSNSIMLKHPRFSSLMVRNSKGVDCWERVHVNIDDHIIVHHPTTTKTRLEDEEVVEAEINAYLADISVSTPLSEKKPLWEVHVLMGMKCVVLRMHHVLGDGASLMSMLNACFGQNSGTDHNTNLNNNNNNNNNIKDSSSKTSNSKKGSWRDKNVRGLVHALWLTLVFLLRLLGRMLWVKDKQSVISGGDGVEIWPRKLITAKFKLDDFRSVKKAIPSATINDVLLGAISYGLSKYLETKSPKATLRGLDVNGLVTVNLRQDAGLQEISNLMGSSFGNKTGVVLHSIHCCNGLHPFEHVKAMKAIMDQKKKSYEALLPYICVKVLNLCFGPKVTRFLYHRVLCNTTLMISNIVGPSKELMIGDNPVSFLRVNPSSLPQAIAMHLVSYNGNADLQLMVAKDIIRDPEFLANYIQESLDQMKNCISHYLTNPDSVEITIQ